MPRPLPMAALALVLVFAVSTGGCSLSDGEAVLAVERHGSGINEGILEPGMPAVVYLLHQWGFGCTGTLIGRRLVLTAKHCVQSDTGQRYPAAGWWVNVGANDQAIVRSYGVSEVRATPGSSIEDSDIGLLLLSETAVETPYPMVFELDTQGLVGRDVLLVGYGLDSCVNGDSGTKYKTEDEVMGWYTSNDFVTEGRGANSGDSGGPIFDPVTMEVIGVISRGGDCEEYPGLTVGVRVDAWRTFINQALTDTGDCARTSLEDLCGDGVDNDCDEVVDDGCNPEGSACTGDSDCASRFCRDVGGGSPICTLPCDFSVSGSCGAGAICKLITCDEGACAPGAAGSLGVGASCAADSECQTLLCRDPGSGRRQCVAPCVVDAGQCLGHEACAPLAANATCGGCAADEEVPGPRRLGERCEVGTDCASGSCLNDGGFSYCSKGCMDHSGCAYGFHCRAGSCVRGLRGNVGEPCIEDDDCVMGFSCYGFTADHPGYCTISCTGGELCPAGTECDGLACVIGNLPLGSGCVGHTDCLSLGCYSFNDNLACTLPCDRQTPCPPVSVCVVSDSGMTLCQPNRLPVIEPPDPPAPKKRGCSAGGSGGWPLFIVSVFLAWRRRLALRGAGHGRSTASSP